MKTFAIGSETDVAPGAVYERRLYFATETLCRIELDPPTAAAFTLERGQDIGSEEAFAQTGRPGLKGFYLRARNSSSRPASFRASATLVPDVAALQRNVEQVVERDWKAAHDEAKKALS